MERLRKLDPLVGLMVMTLMVMIGVTLMRHGLLTRETLYARKPYPVDGMFMGMVMRIEFYMISSAMVGSLLVLMPKRSCILTNIGRNSLTAYVLHVFAVFFLKKFGIMRMLLPFRRICHAAYGIRVGIPYGAPLHGEACFKGIQVCNGQRDRPGIQQMKMGYHLSFHRWYRYHDLLHWNEKEPGGTPDPDFVPRTHLEKEEYARKTKSLQP